MCSRQLQVTRLPRLCRLGLHRLYTTWLCCHWCIIACPIQLGGGELRVSLPRDRSVEADPLIGLQSVAAGGAARLGHVITAEPYPEGLYIRDSSGKEGQRLTVSFADRCAGA